MVCMTSRISSSSSEFSNGCPSADSKDYSIIIKPDFKENLCIKIIHFMFASINKFGRSTIGNLNFVLIWILIHVLGLYTDKPTLMEDASLWHLALFSASSKGIDPDDPDGEVPSCDKFLSEKFLLMGRGLPFVSVTCKFAGGSFIVLLFNLPFKRVFPLPKPVFTRSSTLFCGLLDGEGRG